MMDWEMLGRVVHDWGPTVISVVAYAVMGFAWWGAHRATRAVTDDALNTLLEWRKVHDDEAKQRDVGIAELRQISAAMKATADAQASQLMLMQQELRDYRLGMGRGWTG
jgi:cbb3-type cytochrome oxidase subunit 3